MPRYRILHIIDSLDVGGTESRCLEVIRGAQGLDFEQHLIYFRTGALYSELESLDVRHKEIRLGRFPTSRFWEGIWELVGYMKAYKVDLVQTYGYYSNVPGIIAAKLAGVTTVIASRRDMGLYYTGKQLVVEQLLWKFAHQIVVNAKPIKEALLSAGVPPRKVVVIHNGIDLSDFPIGTACAAPTTPIVGMVARFRPQKDHATFLQAAKLVLARRPDTRFLLVGSGPLQPRMRDHAVNLGIGNQVRFSGEMRGEALRETIRSLTISVLSSKDNEGLPNVILESLAACKPVVATDVGGVSDVIKNGQTGFLVAAGRSEELAERILYLLEHPSEAVAMGILGRGHIEEQFTLRRMQDEFVRIYREALEKAPMHCRWTPLSSRV